MGIDVGSTSIKAVIYRYNGKIVSIGRRKTELFSKKNRAVVWASVATGAEETIGVIVWPIFIFLQPNPGPLRYRFG